MGKTITHIVRSSIWRLKNWFFETAVMPPLILIIFLFIIDYSYFQNSTFKFVIVVLMMAFLLHRDFQNYWNVTSLEYVTDKIMLVNDVTEAMRRTTKLEDLLKMILINLTEDLRFDRAFIFILESVKGKKELWGMSSVVTKEDKLIKERFSLEEDNILSRTVKEKKPFVVNDASEDSRVGKNVKESLELKRFATVPLSSKEKVLGVIVVDQMHDEFDERKKRRISSKDLILLNIFANQAAVTIDNIKLYSHLEDIASKDGLTNLYNRRYFQYNIETQINLLMRYPNSQKAFSIIFLDIDNFKHYNDTNGHPAGDIILAGIGKIILNEARNIDVVARYGGEEFIVLMPSTPLDGVLSLAERIRQRIEEHPFPHKEKQPLGIISVSVGVASYNKGDAAKDVVQRADDGLYEAKKTGKNRACCTSALI